jgi:hypothetical protein
MQSKKRIHLQQFGIIHLPNPDLTYIRNPERKTKLCVCPSTSWKTYIRNPSLFFISFSPSHLEGNNDGNHDLRAHICTWGGEFCQVSIFSKLVCQTVGGQFFLFCQNYMDVKLVWQTVGVSLRRIQKTDGMHKLSAPWKDLSSSLKSSAHTHIASNGVTGKAYPTRGTWSIYDDSTCRIVFITAMYSSSLYFFQFNKY